jgi:plastocyanin
MRRPGAFRGIYLPDAGTKARPLALCVQERLPAHVHAFSRSFWYSNGEERIMSHENAWKAQKWAWVIFAAVFLAGCGIGGPAHKEPSKGINAVVDMGFMIFEPSMLTIHKGDTVEFRNTSLITHTVTDEPARADKPGMAALPKGAAAFDSGKIKAGGVFKHTFTVPGTYKYYCEIHDEHGMLGTIVVTP